MRQSGIKFAATCPNITNEAAMLIAVIRFREIDSI